MKRILKIAAIACTVALSACAPKAEQLSGLIGENRGSDDFNIGVAGYTFRKFNIDETLAYLQRLGVNYLSIKDFWLPLDATAEDMEAFKAKCASYDVDPYILGPIYMRSQEDVDRAFDYVGRFGQTMFIGVPSYDLLDYTIAKVKETGIKVAIHTHGPDNAPFPNIAKIVEMVGDSTIGIGCCMDLGHSVRYGDDIIADIRAYKDWIYDIHMKDETEASKEGRTHEMGRGVMNYKDIVKVLREVGYSGKISLEFEGHGSDPFPAVCESVGYFRGICDAE